MKKLNTLALLVPALALSVSGCATKDYVNEQIANATVSSNKRMDDQHFELASRIDRQGRSQLELEGRVSGVEADLVTVNRTAQEALERANAAGKLAEGKFMYEAVLAGQVAFKLNSDKLSDDGKKALDELAAKLKSDNKNVYLEIQGHTDSTGSDDANMRIALKRAKAVQRYLAIQGGIALHRMGVIAYGESSPVGNNKTRAGRKENRRVKIVVLQ